MVDDTFAKGTRVPKSLPVGLARYDRWDADRV